MGKWKNFGKIHKGMVMIKGQDVQVDFDARHQLMCSHFICLYLHLFG